MFIKIMTGQYSGLMYWGVSGYLTISYVKILSVFKVVNAWIILSMYFFNSHNLYDASFTILCFGVLFLCLLCKCGFLCERLNVV